MITNAVIIIAWILKLIRLWRLRRPNVSTHQVIRTIGAPAAPFLYLFVVKLISIHLVIIDAFKPHPTRALCSADQPAAKNHHHNGSYLNQIPWRITTNASSRYLIITYKDRGWRGWYCLAYGNHKPMPEPLMKGLVRFNKHGGSWVLIHCFQMAMKPRWLGRNLLAKKVADHGEKVTIISTDKGYLPTTVTNATDRLLQHRWLDKHLHWSWVRCKTRATGRLPGINRHSSSQVPGSQALDQKRPKRSNRVSRYWSGILSWRLTEKVS